MTQQAIHHATPPHQPPGDSPAPGVNGAASADMTEPATPQNPAEATVNGITAGEKLKAARLAKGLELQPIAARLKLKKDQLEAIEADDFEPFPALAYALGFMRAYASFLGVDVREEVAAIKAANAAKLQPASIEFPEAQDIRSPIKLTPILAVIALLAAGYGVWSWFDQPATTATSPAPGFTAAPDAGEPAIPPQPLATAPEVIPPVSDTPAPADEPAEMIGTLPAPETETPPRIGGDMAMAATPDEIDAMPAPEPEPAPLPAAPVSPAEEGAIIFTALEDSWIQVKDPAGRILKTGVLQKGQSYKLPDRDGMTMITGNAGGLSVQVGETMLGVLGKSGEIKQNVTLSADALEDLTQNATR